MQHQQTLNNVVELARWTIHSSSLKTTLDECFLTRNLNLGFIVVKTRKHQLKQSFLLERDYDSPQRLISNYDGQALSAIAVWGLYTILIKEHSKRISAQYN